MALVGVGLGLGISSVGPGHPLTPPGPLAPHAASAAPASSTTGPPTTATTATTTSGPVPLTEAQSSAPASLAIPALGITTGLGPARGLNPDGTINDAPLTGPIWSLPWWSSGGPSPGENGSAVLLGHVDSAAGAGRLGTFYRLATLAAGQTVTVTLADGTVTTWVTVTEALYSDTGFPDQTVYDPTGPPMLRLVTCGGTYDPTTHEYLSAVVVTAKLTGITPPS